MTVPQQSHAWKVAERFRTIMAEVGENLSDEHCKELALLIEAALDTVLVEQLENVATKLEKMAHGLRHDERFFS